jgi:hypothetical protein
MAVDTERLRRTANSPVGTAAGPALLRMCADTIDTIRADLQRAQAAFHTLKQELDDECAEACRLALLCRENPHEGSYDFHAGRAAGLSVASASCEAAYKRATLDGGGSNDRR